jgi:hypothetical protein
MGGGGKAPKPTAEQLAMQRQQREALEEEKASSERRLKAVAQKKIGKASLLGTPIQQAEGPAGPMVTEGYKVTSSGGIKKKSFLGRLHARTISQGMFK